MEQRKSFVFYTSFAEAIEDIHDPKTELNLYKAIVKYGSTGEMPEDMNGVERAFMKLIQPVMDANQRRYENGTKGGRPKTSEEPTNNLEKTEEKPRKNQSKTKAKPKLQKAKPYEDGDADADVNGDVKEDNNPVVLFPHGMFMNVMLSTEDYAKLTDTYGVPTTDRYIDDLSIYIKDHGNKYKNHYLTVLSWMRRKNEPEKKKGQSDLLSWATKLMEETSA